MTFDEKNNIRSKLRAVARLLILLREETHETNSLSEFFKPKYYEAFECCVLKIRETNKQLAFTVGNYVKQLCIMNISMCIRKDNFDLQKLSKNFLNEYNSSWGAIASSTTRMQRKSKINRKEDLPTMDDLKKLYNYLQEEIEKSAESYTNLQKVVLAYLILFNKRRPAEVANVTISDFRISLEMQEDREEIFAGLSPVERSMAQRYKTPVLLIIIRPQHEKACSTIFVF